MTTISHKWLCILALFFVSLPIYAQSSASSTLVLDEASLTPVYTDDITGLNIDPISKDRSNRPCARIRLHINRMTRAEINEIEVITIGGNVIVSKREVSYDGTGLIIELTAKPETKFYLHHEDFGDSNPVNVSLQGNKEYMMEAWNEVKHPVTIICRTLGADVYLDEEYIGPIGHDGMVTIPNVSSGSHDLRVVAGEDEAFKQIYVSNEQAAFNVELRDAELLYGTLTFKLVPFEASVEIDGETLTSEDGVINRRTRYGTYAYKVFSKGYHEKTGTVTVDTTSVSRHITLNRMVASLTVKANDNMKLWVNDGKVGKGTLTGEIDPATYEIKAKAPGYYPSVKTIEITPEMTELTVDMTESLVPYENHFLAMASASVYPSLSYGAMLGYVKTVGGYVKYRSNFDSTKGLYDATSDLNIASGGYFWPSGAKAESIMTVSGGMLLRAAKSLYPYFGAGYGARKIMWQDAGGKWANITDYTYAGISAEAGLIFKFGPVALSAGVSTTAFKYTAAEVGIGVML